jgi:RNA polymerase sigma-70 factor, ECF subfamily
MIPAAVGTEVRATGGRAPSMANEDDLELFHRWAAGEVDAGQRLVVRYYDPVYFFFASKLADHAAMELTQDTFETACEKAGSLRLHASFASYLFGIARWKLVTSLRSRVNQGFDPLSDACPDPGPGSTVTALLEQRHEESVLMSELRQLPLDDRILLELRLYEGLRLAEIAEILGLSKDRAAYRLTAAKRRLVHAAAGVTTVDETLTSLTTYVKEVRAALTGRIEAHDREPVAPEEAERVGER